MRVMKFGGTSVGNASAIRKACEIVKNAAETRPIVVVSALANVTNVLVEIANTKPFSQRRRKIEALRERHERVLSELELPVGLLDKIFEELVAFAKKKTTVGKKSLDHFMSFGERFSARIVAACLERIGVPSRAFDAWEIGMATDDHFGSAEPLSTASRVIKKKINYSRGVPVVTGFIGKTRRGDITTLGRGGSDYTAAVIGAAIDAEAIEIWKDVDGFMTADPRIIPAAKVVPELSFEEASELAYFGAKVLHPKTIVPAMQANVPVRVLNTFKPKSKGTLIIINFQKRKKSSVSVDALTYRKGVSVIHVYTPEFFDGNKIISDVFGLFDTYHVNIDLIAMSVASVSLVMDETVSLPKAILRGLEKIGRIVIKKRKTIVCAVGGSTNTAGAASRIFGVLETHGIPVELISQASSGYSMTFVVDEKDAEHALRVLHKEFIR